MTHLAIPWVLGLMLHAAPPDKLAAAPQFPGYEETADDKRARYESFAADLVEVAYDASVRPLFAGPKARAHTAATLLGVVFHESGFAKDVDQGPCYRGRNGQDGRCDGGLSACTAQIRLGAGTTTLGSHGIEGLTQADLFRDRKLCFRVALHLIRRSFVACAKEKAVYRLNAYASGTCDHGHVESKSIHAIVQGFLAARAAVPRDEGLVLPLPPPAAPSALSLLDPGRPSE